MFPTTRWTLVLASQEDAGSRRAALEQLFAIYWRPLYIYARRKGLGAAEAEDAVQGLFLQLLERDFPNRLDPARGRLRSYLKASFDHFVINLHEREAAQKRGGGQPLVPLDALPAERELASAPEAPEAAYDREWALTVMERALRDLRGEYEAGRRKGDAETVLRFFRPDAAPSYAEAATACGMSVPQFKASLHRARARFRDLLKEQVADTIDGSGAEAELEQLVRALRT